MLPDIKVTLRVIEGDFVNVKWTWKDEKKKVFEVPNDYITTEGRTLSGDLSQFVKISEDPFMIRILNGAGAEVFAINGMIYDEYLNWVLA